MAALGGRVMVRIRVAWWLKYYVYALVFVFVAHVMRTTPDAEKLAAVVARAIRVEVV